MSGKQPDFLISTGWLHRDDFARFIRTGTPLTDGVTKLAQIDWQAAIASRDAGHLPCSGGENRILRLAASIAVGIPVDLNHALSSLDEASISLITRAARHANGQRPLTARTADDVRYITRFRRNHNTRNHRRRETSQPESASPNRHTNPLHTASAERRHSFAVKTLLGWYRDGQDVQARMPALSTYLGHASPAATYWYLSATPELLALAAGRLESMPGGAR